MMRLTFQHIVFSAAVLSAGFAWANSQPYASEQTRDIASLSDADIAALQAGQGWGLAKPAELNGYPGPLHVLELADALDLTDDQRRDVQEIFDAMRQDAGAAYIAAEAHVSQMFQRGHADPDRLAALLSESAEALARLRAVHLNAHLKTTPLLTDAQNAAYASLRGYDGTQSHDGHSGHDHN